jgi:predicted amidophosphoribosyltransferase
MTGHNRLKREHQTVSKMIALYCRAHHTPHHGELCAKCQSLAEYARERIERCPFGWQKPTCAKCPVHCYKPDRREDIRQVMRYAGPRMLLYHPWLAVLHLIDHRRKPPAR